MASHATALVLVVLAAALTPNDALHFDAEAAKEHPVSKVVALLKDMKKDLEQEADADEEVYEKLACWCETTDKSKTKAIADAEARIKDLDATVEKMAALSQTLQVEIQGLEKEIAADQKSLATATAMREKAASEFTGEEKEMIESIRALQAAVAVISKQHGGKSASFLNNHVVADAYATAKALMAKHFQLLQGVITPSQRHVLASFVQGGGSSGSTPAFKQSYSPQSGEIFGILRQMKETFESNLATSQKDEIAAQEAFVNLKKAKEEEIKAGQESLEAKKQQLASADETLAQSKEDREDTYASLGADKKLLMEVKVKCKMTDKEWEERQKLRQSELQAVAKAIEILSSDEARDKFSKVFNPAVFLQTGVTRQRGRDKAFLVLSRLAVQSPKLKALAVAVRLDPFPKVKKAIDDMVEALLKEKASDIEQKKFCTDEFFSNEKSTAEKMHTKGKLDNKIAGLGQAIKEQTAAIETLDAEIKELNDQRKKASDDRAAEKQEFERLVGEHKETEKLLQEALTALKEVYSSEGSLLQQAPPTTFSKYGKSRASSGIIAMIEQIITDTQLMTKEAQRAEQDAIDTFAKLVQMTNEALQTKDDAKVDLVAQKAQTEKDLTAAKSELKGTTGEIEALEKSVGDLHKQCDFLLKNFEITQKARDEEIEALRQAKAFLSGMQSDA